MLRSAGAPIPVAPHQVPHFVVLAFHIVWSWHLAGADDKAYVQDAYAAQSPLYEFL